MGHYLFKRLLLLPLTLCIILLLNFAILNLAPGEPTTQMDLSATGEAVGTQKSSSTNDPYILFRQHYGLHLPIFINRWPLIKKSKLLQALSQLHTQKKDSSELNYSHYQNLKRGWRDRGKYIPKLLFEVLEGDLDLPLKIEALNLLVNSGIRCGYQSSFLTNKQKLENQKISKNNLFLSTQSLLKTADQNAFETNLHALKQWAEANQLLEPYSFSQKIHILFTETRFFCYFSKVLRLDFGTLRNDSNKKVTHEVFKRMKYSIVLCAFPLLISFVLCQFFGILMAYFSNRWIDHGLSIFFLVLYALPIFVVCPFLIEKIALHHHFFFSKIPIPLSGFHSSDEIYHSLLSYQRLKDISLHILLPLLASLYHCLAVQSRISKTAFLEALSQDYIKTAKAKGLKTSYILYNYVGRNAGITIITSLTTSIGVLLSGSLIIETLFGIDGFGKFFYSGVLNRDYHVILFSTLLGSFFSVTGYLLGDICYASLDPRVRFT